MKVKKILSIFLILVITIVANFGIWTYDSIVLAQEPQGSVISYPPKITTDYQRLAAVYSLIEQMRLEHNQQGEIALNNPEKYINSGKWAKYTKLYQEKHSIVAHEKLRLKNRIRQAYGDAEWREKPVEEKEVLSNILFGNREKLKTTPVPDGVVCAPFDQLKAISLDELNGDFVDPYENFTTYTEQDDGGYLSVAENVITFTNAPNNEVAYVRKAHTISGDFEHLHKWTSTWLADDYAFAGVWDINDGYDSWWTQKNAYNGAVLYIKTYSGASGYGCYLYSAEDDDYEAESMWTSSTTRYCTTWRSGTDLHSSLYTDAARTNLDDTLDVTFVTDSFDYVYPFIAQNAGDASASTGTSEDLDLQEATAEITNAPSTQAWGIVSLSENSTTAINYFTVNNTGGVAVDVTIQGTDLSGGDDTWDLSDDASIGDNIYGLRVGLDDDDDTFDIVVGEASATEFITNLGTSDNQSWGLCIYMPSAVTGYDNQQMSATLTLVASEHT